MLKRSKARAMAFLIRAREFFSAAEALFAAETGPKATSKWRYPIYFCYSHAAELALKAFLRSHNPEVEFGHTLTDRYRDCVALGLVVDPNDPLQVGNVVTLLDCGNQDRASGILWAPASPIWRGREKSCDD